jgi:hypothetical protein
MLRHRAIHFHIRSFYLISHVLDTGTSVRSWYWECSPVFSCPCFMNTPRHSIYEHLSASRLFYRHPKHPLTFFLITPIFYTYPNLPLSKEHINHNSFDLFVGISTSFKIIAIYQVHYLERSICIYFLS